MWTTDPAVGLSSGNHSRGIRRISAKKQIHVCGSDSRLREPAQSRSNGKLRYSRAVLPEAEEPTSGTSLHLSGMRLDNQPARPLVAVVIPAFNEETVIGDVVRGVRRWSDITILVDDGSSDRTATVAAKAGASVVRHVLNRGQGASIQTGITCALRAGASYVVTFDADGQHRPEDVDALLNPLRAGLAEVTLGSRFLGQSTVPPLRRALLRLATIFTRVASGVPVTDTHNGLRGFTREAAARIRIRQDRMAHASEILDEIRKLDLRYVEVPVSIRYSDYSLRKGQSSLGAFRVLWDYLLGRWSR